MKLSNIEVSSGMEITIGTHYPRSSHACPDVSDPNRFRISPTAASNLGISKPYVCYDTFQGFVSEQCAEDIALGTPRALRYAFSANSMDLARKILRQLGAEHVKLVKADIITMPVDALPPTISAALLDVDLSEPTEVGLRKVWPRLEPGGIVVVDDCSPEWDDWKAEIGYKRLCAESGLSERYEFGMGMLKK